MGGLGGYSTAPIIFDLGVGTWSTHKCPHCGYLDDRDTNAAINILVKALQGLAQLPSGRRKVTPGDEMTLWSDGETQKSKVARRARKPRQ